MGHVAAERDLDHDDEDEPQQVECIEVDDEDEECSTSNDPPQLHRSYRFQSLHQVVRLYAFRRSETSIAATKVLFGSSTRNGII